MAKLQVKSFRDLTEARSRFLTQVDEQAEALRRQHITASPGQTMTYEAKYQEALAYPNGEQFPFLEREAEGLGTTVDAVVESVLVARHRWEYIGSRIEADRLRAKARIRQATTAAEMHRIAKEAFDALG